MRVIGAYQSTKDGLHFRDPSGKLWATFEFDDEGSGCLQVYVLGEWVWLSPLQARELLEWLRKKEGAVIVARDFKGGRHEP